MANELKSETEADALLKMVNEQIALSAFDSNDTGLLKQMVENLGDKRGMVRLGFAEALGKVGKPAVPFLVEAVRNHRDPVVRRSSAKALALIRDATTIPSLIQAILTDEDTVVRSSSVGALAKMGEASVPVLLETLASPESPETTKGLMTWALAFIGAEAKEQLYKAFDSDLPEVRSAIVGAIAKVAEEEQEERAFELLTNSLKDSASSVRSEAACALGNLDYQPAVPCLLELLGIYWSRGKRAVI